MSDDWLAALNAGRDPTALTRELRACCAAPAWIEAVYAGRPYADAEQLGPVSDAAVFALDDVGLAQALAAHPRIGERSGGAEAAWSSQEQAGMSAADAAVRAQMDDGNRRYEAKFGQVYLVCATGLSAAQLLAICTQRLGNDAATERAVVLGELAQIARIRLAKLMDGSNR
jgi:2-oxo-4-hydroxy-4-carboxy-5-ureidoimidazoline decarboxylase